MTDQPSDTQRLLQASIELIERDQRIDRLLRENESLRSDLALYRARLDFLSLRRIRDLQAQIIDTDIPALLRRQAE